MMEKEILSVKEVIAVTGMSRTTIHRKEKAGEFPARRQLSSRKVGWLRSEIREWLTALPKANAEA